MMNRPALRFATRSELKRLIYQAQTRYPDCRPGQALCNMFGLGPKWEAAIYELKTPDEVINVLMFYYREINPWD